MLAGGARSVEHDCDPIKLQKQEIARFSLQTELEDLGKSNEENTSSEANMLQIYIALH